MSGRKIHIISLLLILSVVGAEAQPEDLQLIWHTTGNYPNSRLGSRFVSGGDINGDGYDDIIASAWEDGLVYLYFGGDPMDTIPDIVFNVPHDYEFGNLPRECRDLNGDGYPDVTIQGDSLDPPYNFLYLFFGGPYMDNQPDLIFPADMLGYFQNDWGDYSSMGDFNGDGYYDLIVANKGYYPPLDMGTGKIYVYYGGPNIDIIPDWTVTGYYNNYSSLGEQISCSGDVNNDGYDDILCMGVYSGNAKGLVLFHGGTQPDTLVDWQIQSVEEFLGSGISIIHDFSGDGCDEVVFGDQFECGSTVYFGGVVMNYSWDVWLDGIGNSNSVSGYIGDINNDGWGDYAISDQYSGNINIFFLSPNIIGNVSPQFYFQENYAWNLDYAGDINGDGTDEFMSSTRYNPNGYNYQGQIFIYSYNNSKITNNHFNYTSTVTSTLNSCYPNPFNSQIIIPYSIRDNGNISLNVFDITGRKVIQLLNGETVAGNHQITWNAEGLSSGIYFINLSDGKNTDTEIIQLVK